MNKVLDHLSKILWLEVLYKKKYALRSVEKWSHEPRWHDG